MVAKKSRRKHGARVWMTKGQIAQKYSDKAVAEQICAAKMADEATRDSQTKPHPDLPDSEAQTGVMVFCWWSSNNPFVFKDMIFIWCIICVPANDSHSTWILFAVILHGCDLGWLALPNMDEQIHWPYFSCAHVCVCV